MTESTALKAVEEAARGVVAQRNLAVREGRELHRESLMALILALSALDRAREEAAQREAKRIHAYQETRPSDNVLTGCGLTVSVDEVHLNRRYIKCPPCQETFRGRYCPGGHPGTECLPSCWGYVMGEDLAAQHLDAKLDALGEVIAGEKGGRA